MPTVPALLSIGEFSQVTHLSIRTLRRYHDAGLLEPTRIDATSGYRWYAPDPIPPAQVIHRLRELDVPLADVHRIVTTPDLGARSTLIAEHLQRLEDQLERTRAAVTSLQRLLRPEATPLQVELRTEPATQVAAVEDVVDLDDVLGWYAGAMAELDAVVTDAEGPPAGRYDNELFTEGRGTVMVFRRVTGPQRPVGRVRPILLPAAELAVTTHVGSHDDIAVTYGQLGAWVAEHALVVAGPVRETYLCGPRDTPEPSAWRTEIGWPVFAVSAG